MRIFAVISILCLTAGSAYAETLSCTVQATNKKLHGAALTSFMKKCACEASALSKKLAGAAKNSFMKKCVTDATRT
jgi:hypothetical protein